MSAPLEIDIKYYWRYLSQSERSELGSLITTWPLGLIARYDTLREINQCHVRWNISADQIDRLCYDRRMQQLIQQNRAETQAQPRTTRSLPEIPQSPTVFVDANPTVHYPRCTVCSEVLRDEHEIFRCRHCSKVYCRTHAGNPQQPWIACADCQQRNHH